MTGTERLNSSINSTTINETILSVLNGEVLNSLKSEEIFEHLFSGQLSEIELSGILTAMKLRGESSEEICGAARSMRKFCTDIDLGSPMIFDTCGTGGDNSGSINISSSVSIILSALGVPIAKHGNRSVSGKSGSTDFMEALNIPTSLTGEERDRYFKENNFLYMAAPNYHPAMKFAVPVRKKLGVRTIFNYLGPITNPAGTRRQAIGFFSHELLEKYAETVKQMGFDRVLVYSSLDGMDEVSPYATTIVYEVYKNSMGKFTVEPEKYISAAEASELPSDLSPEENAALFTETVSSGQITPVSRLLAMNGAVALYAYDEKTSIDENYSLILEALTDGRAAEKLSALREK